MRSSKPWTVTKTGPVHVATMRDRLCVSFIVFPHQSQKTCPEAFGYCQGDSQGMIYVSKLFDLVRGNRTKIIIKTHFGFISINRFFVLLIRYLILSTAWQYGSAWQLKTVARINCGVRLNAFTRLTHVRARSSGPVPGPTRSTAFYGHRYCLGLNQEHPIFLFSVCSRFVLCLFLLARWMRTKGEQNANTGG